MKKQKQYPFNLVGPQSLPRHLRKDVNRWPVRETEIRIKQSQSYNRVTWALPVYSVNAAYMSLKTKRRLLNIHTLHSVPEFEALPANYMDVHPHQWECYANIYPGTARRLLAQMAEWYRQHTDAKTLRLTVYPIAALGVCPVIFLLQGSLYNDTHRCHGYRANDSVIEDIEAYLTTGYGHSVVGHCSYPLSTYKYKGQLYHHSGPDITRMQAKRDYYRWRKAMALAMKYSMPPDVALQWYSREVGARIS